MVDRWREIADGPAPIEVKQAECASVLREFVERMAWARIRGANRPLRFYADMLVLQELVRPTFATDEFGKIAIWPAYGLVTRWLDEHKSG
jgi:hypothetical protein